MSITATDVYVIVQKDDDDGASVGIHKSTGRIYFNREDAESTLERFDKHMRKHYKVEPCVIMDSAEFYGATR